MQLTERQCWDIIRKLVSDKNKEYAKFLIQSIGKDNLSMCVGYTKSLYLNKFGLSDESEFRYILKHRGEKPKKEWLDNLSSEDLLLFLDFRCRALQKMYDYYLSHNAISVKEIRDLIVATKRSSLINYNAGRLKATGKPDMAENELDLKDENIDEAMIEQALSQIMHNIATNHAQMVGVSVKSALEKASKLTTTNTDIQGFITGYKFKGKHELTQYSVDTNSAHQKPLRFDDDRPHMVGYDANMFPVFIKGDNYVTVLGEVINDVEIVYDTKGNKIIEDTDEQQTKFVGFDIQGTPVYLDSEGYYNSIGERLPEDVYIVSNDETFNR